MAQLHAVQHMRIIVVRVEFYLPRWRFGGPTPGHRNNSATITQYNSHVMAAIGVHKSRTAARVRVRVCPITDEKYKQTPTHSRCLSRKCSVENLVPPRGHVRRQVPIKIISTIGSVQHRPPQTNRMTFPQKIYVHDFRRRRPLQ